ncbi:MAG: family 14 glycosylhydrolase [Armatimonadota bacterium]|nr:family 14 glycosylhydrolase [bacterium]
MYYTFGCDTDESSAPVYKSLGATSIESYVTWETCEKAGEGKWDWSRWDRQVKILKANDLKWVPFLIVGPAYSTPNWFRASKDHFPCRCLEHGTDSKIESLWNPNLPKWIDRFINEFAKQYKDSGVIESLLLGVQGDFGEAIYSAWGGGWTFNIPGEYHNHEGYWCNDPYALASFRKFVQKRYRSVEIVNKTWGTDYSALADVDFPGYSVDAIKAIQAKAQEGNPQARRHWLDFVDWYRESMTDWSDWWISTVRKYFPKTPIYLCTGGDSTPALGSNFAEQCRIAAKHKAGVRITNEDSNYAPNFAKTRWVVSAGKFYDAFYGIEPAGKEDEVGIVARIYNATASGANQLYDYSVNIISKPSSIEVQRKNIKHLFYVEKPVVPVALWYPNVSMTIKWGDYLNRAASFRQITDWDYVDETMLHAGALDRYKVLVILRGEIMETEDARRIAKWVSNGGRLIVTDVPKFESVETTSDPEKILFGDTPKGRVIGSGRIERFDSSAMLAKAVQKALSELNLPVCKAENDGVFATQIDSHRFLIYNSNAVDSKVEITCKGKKVISSSSNATDSKVEISCEDKKVTSAVPGGTICEVAF